MADQIRLVTIKRGYDPRQFSLVVLGGAGPVHGAALAAEMGMAEVLVPEAPGVLAAFGLLAAAIEHHHARTLQARTDVADLDAVNRCLGELDARRARPDARGGRGGRAGARGVRRRHALRRPGVRAGGADRGAGHARADAGHPGRVPRRARARLRLRAHAAAGGVRELPRGAHLPAAAAGGDAGRARDRHAGRRAPGRAPRVLRQLHADGDLRAGAAAAGRAPGRAGHRRAERHDHRDPARRHRARGRRRQPAPAESRDGHRPDPARGAAQPARRHRRRDGADAPQERGLADRQGRPRRLGRALQHAGRDHRAGGGDPDPPGRACSSRRSASCARSRRNACARATPSCSTIRTTAAPTCPTSPWRCRCSPTAAWWPWPARCATTRTSAAARPAACRPTPPSSTRRA